MATYIGPDGEVDAILLDQDRQFTKFVAHRGGWLVTGKDGRKNVVEPKYFDEHYRQKYPRHVEEVCRP